MWENVMLKSLEKAKHPKKKLNIVYLKIYINGNMGS